MLDRLASEDQIEQRIGDETRRRIGLAQDFIAMEWCEAK